VQLGPGPPPAVRGRGAARNRVKATPRSARRAEEAAGENVTTGFRPAAQAALEVRADLLPAREVGRDTRSNLGLPEITPLGSGRRSDQVAAAPLSPHEHPVERWGSGRSAPRVPVQVGAGRQPRRRGRSVTVNSCQWLSHMVTTALASPIRKTARKADRLRRGIPGQEYATERETARKTSEQPWRGAGGPGEPAPAERPTTP